eukprot:860121_1
MFVESSKLIMQYHCRIPIDIIIHLCTSWRHFTISRSNVVSFMDIIFWIIVISMVIFIVGVGYFCLSNYSQSDMQSQNENKIKEESRTSETREDADVEKGEHKKDEDEMDVADIKMVKEDEIDEDEQEKRLCCIPSDPVQASNIHFYILMFFGCLYIMMVMTKWEWTANPKDMDHDGKSNQIVAANIIAHWAVAVLYLVTLIAPMICPGRFVYDDVDDTE